MTPEVRKDAEWALNYHREELAKQEEFRTAAPFDSGERLMAQASCNYHAGAIDALESLLAKHPVTTGRRSA